MANILLTTFYQNFAGLLFCLMEYVIIQVSVVLDADYIRDKRNHAVPLHIVIQTTNVYIVGVKGNAIPKMT